MKLRKIPHIPFSSKMTSSSSIKGKISDHSIIFSEMDSKKKVKTLLKSYLHSWQLKELEENKEVFYFDSKKGPLAICFLQESNKKKNQGHYQLLTPSLYGRARNFAGSIIGKFKVQNIKNLNVYGLEITEQIWGGIIVGIEMSSYHYVKKYNFKTALFNLSKDSEKVDIKKYIQLGYSTNLSRYLVDLPPGEKRPEDYAKLLKNLFYGKNNCKLTIWDEKKLKKERMGMILAVGGASVQPPRLVHLSYRPNKKTNEKPIAFVGKGITFDSGGLDIKPPSGMRNMKKDMGGSASLVGLANYIVNQKLNLNCDFYFALAENAVDAHSFRPGDVLESRKGLTVEIDNTDAEGRLVLGDALTVAAENKPKFIIDVATLTGAIKVALGAETGGLFSNSDELADQLLSQSQSAGEQVWRMPLLKEQRSKLSSPVADLANSSSGFGGAVRAAMFLQEFIGDTPWAHFDIYSWVDSANGPYFQKGGNGQLVQSLSFLVQELCEK